jgi:hypothetical protein
VCVSHKFQRYDDHPADAPVVDLSLSSPERLYTQ